MPKCHRGEVWWVDMGMVAKVRPALFLSVSIEEDERSIVCVVPHTTSIRGTRFESASSLRWLKPGAFDAQGISTYQTRRLRSRIGVLPPVQLEAVENRVRLWLQLPLSPDG